MTQSTPLKPVTLTGRLVRLEPLSHEHHDELCEAVRDGELWRLWYTTVPTPDGMAAEIDRRLGLQEAGSMLPFATRRLADDRVIGMTSYMNIDPTIPRVEIGSTWNSASAQGTGTNADSKLALLGYAFDTLGCPAVELRTAWINTQSRRAIERLGAKLDGVLRRHSYTRDGSLRDTCVYSITADEWPQVRSMLRFRLGEDVVA
ncbi:GNAT family N-acetyltransferase [Brevibacterium sp. 91QC2O2]|uniref:GNAT family N-acetyltransferase n=1 Tax=Brevibacterium TaxID=1696 RepID=UPI00211BA483|nr:MULTISPECIES: GNAT family protein [unclassified Brevibacterium]MCQ9369106.1 GNAT family N-acetyltransferase [Brevibacterium sp. 91QC2O2]MCQ9386463.1 GNAT family N-acetyltransferase [Brevibacterium sp. 68QC2CO]